MHKKMQVFSLVTLLLANVSLNAQAEVTAYEFGGAMTLETVSNVHGGIERGTRNLANLDVTLAIDTTAAGWWQDGSWFIYVLGDYGKNPSDLSGDVQTLSNIATDNALKIYEFWYQHSFSDDRIKLLVGLHDYNSTFYTLDSASLFSLASFGIGPDTSQATPSIFSTTSVGAHLTIEQNQFYGLLAIYDGIPGDPDHPHGTHIQFNKGDGLFKAAEFGIAEDKQYKLGIGGWQQTANVENPVNAGLINNNTGYYLIGEKYFSEDLVAFFQYGRADDENNRFDKYWGMGLRRNNYWRQDDALGIGYAKVQNGLPFLQNNPEFNQTESVYEASYFLPVVEKVNVQGSLYVIRHPNALPDLANAVALGLRLYIEY